MSGLLYLQGKSLRKVDGLQSHPGCYEGKSNFLSFSEIEFQSWFV
jgi:hypothetical protein